MTVDLFFENSVKSIQNGNRKVIPQRRLSNTCGTYFGQEDNKYVLGPWFYYSPI